MRTIAIINQKGGCGKTTTAINLSAMLARAGQRTLLVDLDSQSHCAAGLGIPESKIEMDIGDAMLAAGTKPIDLARLLWQPASNFDLAPSRMRLAGLEASRGGLADKPDRERRLATAISHIAADHDLVCIDCAPSIGLLTYNALVAADVVLIPVETSFFSLQGATRQVNTVKSLSRKLGINRQVWILPTIHDASNEVANDLLDELYRRFGERVIPCVIRRDSKLREAASFGQAIIDYAPGSGACEDYARLADWVVTHWAVSGQIDAALAESMAIDDAAAEEPVQDEYGAEEAEGQAAGSEGEEAGDGERAEAAAGRSSLGGVVLTDGIPAPTRVGAAANVRPPLRLAGAGPAYVGQTRQAPSNVGAGANTGVPAPEIKPGNRAEEVARRAQEFLRRGQPRGAGGWPQAQAEEIAARSVPVRPVVEKPVMRPVHAAARRLLGAQETNQGVLFVQPANSGVGICVAGTFNNWSTTAHPMRRNDELGVFELCLPLAAGKHYYRLVIDGAWSADPYNNVCEVNPIGEANSVIMVGQRGFNAAPELSPEVVMRQGMGEQRSEVMPVVNAGEDSAMEGQRT